MQSCSVVGPRRIGKSSLLYHLTQPAVYGSHLPDPDSYIFGFMDLQELASLEPDDFFFTAVEQLSRASRGGLDVDLDRGVADVRIAVPGPGIPRADATSARIHPQKTPQPRGMIPSQHYVSSRCRIVLRQARHPIVLRSGTIRSGLRIRSSIRLFCCLSRSGCARERGSYRC